MSNQRRSSKNVLFVSLGCAKNLVDTEVMCGKLATEGFLLTDDPDSADIMVINTCGFIADARNEADAEIQEALQWKNADKRRLVVVTGCVPQRDAEDTLTRYPDADLFLGVDDVPDIARHLEHLITGQDRSKNRVRTEKPCYVYDHSTPRLQLTPANYAYVKIAEGCSHGCRFCSIPRIRGPRRSRPLESIVKEAEQFLAQGVGELNLIAQDTSAYGNDLPDSGSCLAALLKRLDKLEGDFWIRVLYMHPANISEELIDAFAHAHHVVPYIDVPLQHISDSVLSAMGRGFDGAATRALMEKLRERIPGVALRTTFLVGYPGETAADFAELYDFVSAFAFDRMGVFAFSPEPGTPAAGMTDQAVSAEVAQQRRDALLSRQQDISLKHNCDLVGTKQKVLTVSQEDDDVFVGRTYADAPEVDNFVYFTGGAACLDHPFTPVEITAAHPYDLEGVQS